jgi:tetratricopeptide (TPR) repeat protein
VDCEDLGEQALKGIREPVKTFKLRGIRASVSKDILTPLVGRKTEVQQFSAILEACAETGTGQALCLRGEAGIGKTRLTEEFEKLAAASGFACHRALILDFGVGKGQDAIRSLIRSFLALSSRSGQAELSEAAERAFSEGLLDRSQAIYLNDLLDLPQPVEMRSLFDAMDNAKRNQGKRETVAALVRSLCNRKPLFLVIEDIHWADDLILDHLAGLTRSISDQPAVLIMTSRIEGDPLEQAWRASTAATPLMTVDLRPLRHDDALTLAAEFFDTTTQFALSCVERAEGNPLFLEQLLRNAETTAQESVPGSVRSLVQARMDMLDRLDKQALQAASVLGQRFSLDALRHLIESPHYTCEDLIERYLVRPEGEDYLFVHALVQEGVYSSLLTNRRAELHRSAANWYSGRDLVLRAEHLDRAGDPGAAVAFLDATQAQVDMLHFETALKLANRGIDLATDSNDKCDLMCLRGDALHNTGATKDSITAFETALETAEDGVRRCRAWIGMADGSRVSDRQEQALRALDNAEAAALSEELTPELSKIHYLRGNVFFPLGNIDGCLAEHEQALKLARQAGSEQGEALALSGLGDAYYLRGHMRTACEQFRACIDLCRKNGFGRIEVANRHMVGWTRIFLMEFAEALEDALASINMAAQVSHHRAELLGLMLAGTVEHILGRNADAHDHLERGLKLSRTIGAGNFEVQCLVRLARLNASEGNLSKARDLADRSLIVARRVGMTFFGPIALAVSASLAEDPDQRKSALDEAEAILDSGCVGHNHTMFAEIAIDKALEMGEWTDAERYAARLEDYTREQRLDWPDFMIERGNTLAAWGRGDRSAELQERIIRQMNSAELAGMASAMPVFNKVFNCALG